MWIKVSRNRVKSDEFLSVAPHISTRTTQPKLVSNALMSLHFSPRCTEDIKMSKRRNNIIYTLFRRECCEVERNSFESMRDTVHRLNWFLAQIEQITYTHSTCKFSQIASIRWQRKAHTHTSEEIDSGGLNIQLNAEDGWRRQQQVEGIGFQSNRYGIKLATGSPKNCGGWKTRLLMSNYASKMCARPGKLIRRLRLVCRLHREWSLCNSRIEMTRQFARLFLSRFNKIIIFHTHSHPSAFGANAMSGNRKHQHHTHTQMYRYT